jgi:hypothetical protein
MVKVEDIKTVFKSKQKGFKIGSLFLHGYGDITLQIFKGKIEGIAVYGILDNGYIDLNNPIGVDFKQYLKFNTDNNQVEIKYI